MSDSQWLWDPLTICQMGPLRENKTCCGITKKGDACQLIVKKETLKEGRHKLNNLARSPFNLSTLDSQLSDIAPFFLCKQWHRARQHDDIKQQWFNAAVRNQTDAQDSPRQPVSQITGEEIDRAQQETASTALEPDEFPPTWGSTWLDVTLPPGRDVTPDMLAMNRVYWDVSSDDPAILSIHNEYGGLHSLQIHAVRQESCPDGEKCSICLEGDSDECAMLQCDTCKGVVHLGCMEGWLAHRLPGNNTSCPPHRCHGSFSALLRSSAVENTTADSTAETPLDATYTLEEETSVPTTPPQRRSTRPTRRSDRLQVSTSSLIRRSPRSRRVPDRFRP
ncbi:uncharacterized protein N7446_014146 [Penicillium canescens]|uniref:RING-type domain-containing protein n=1 Tax=Penicillium canescens TaxID=5083 RepID=A0AAD6N1F4_PENCN|nr:uncharacterized protein N7446_014146 [Penicillium canescens]KAJ6022346.1 hypothetical protein N7460_014090 [Penicillium canescens]KAJ6038994.1 hypothetical protein N7446_014146 [Penicillium canescens]KAJ6066234.1 hypothetical protein N7444_000226 [Penicillium canescens]KAJ6174669.1 hypothetical protein N7485_005406 [Penicillium canescens]